MPHSLPPSLAQFIAVVWQTQAAAAYAAAVELLIASHVEQEKDNMRRSVVALLDGLGESPTQDAPLAPNKLQRIAGGKRGVYHDQYVATFRAKFPNGESDLRNICDHFPGGTKLSQVQMDIIKRHFGMGVRSLLLAPMLRELGFYDDSRGQWTTPVLRIVPTDSV